MQKSEMRLVLFLLQDKTNISKTYRQMAKETGLSLGSVQGVMSDLAMKRWGFAGSGAPSKRMLALR